MSRHNKPKPDNKTPRTAVSDQIIVSRAHNSYGGEVRQAFINSEFRERVNSAFVQSRGGNIELIENGEKLFWFTPQAWTAIMLGGSFHFGFAVDTARNGLVDIAPLLRSLPYAPKWNHPGETVIHRFSHLSGIMQ